jgi:hypothetical protein
LPRWSWRTSGHAKPFDVVDAAATDQAAVVDHREHVVAVAIDVGVDQLAMVIREGTVIGLRP